MRFLVVILLVALASCSGPEPEPVLRAKPLAARAAVDGPRFRRLDAATTGLEFTNVLRPENVFAYVHTGSGIAVGDYDADGLPDLYLVARDGSNKLFRQTAPMRFEDVTAAAGGLDGGDAWGTAAAFADVDGDGDLDLYVANLESPNLLYLNRGDGTFKGTAGLRGLGVSRATEGIAFGDYDNDGDLDVYLVTNRLLGTQLPPEIVKGMTLPSTIKKSKRELFPPYPKFGRQDGQLTVPAGYEDYFAAIGDKIYPAGQCDVLLRNDDGVFQDVTAEAGIADQGNGLSAVWWDADGDGDLDLYVANDLQSPDAFYENEGNGTFRNATEFAMPHVAFFGMGCDFGDLDRDGDFELYVADMSSTTHYMGKMLMGNMDQHRWLLMNGRPLQQMRNVLYVNTGTGRFREAAHAAGLASTDWTWSVRFADFDEDGWLDLHATNGIPVFTDNPDVGRKFDQLWAHGAKRQALELYRKIPRVKERNAARRGGPGMSFTDVGKEWGLDEESVGQGAVVCDLDRDGDLDVLVNNLNDEVSLFENRTAGTHRLLVELRGVRSNRFGLGARLSITTGDITQTRMVMGSRGYMSAGEPVEHFGLGDATQIDRLEVRWPSGVVQVLEDLAADQHLVIREEGEPARAADAASGGGSQPLFTQKFDLPFMHREREFDDYAVQPLLPHRLSRLGPGLAVGDADGDGRDDCWVGGAAGQAGMLFLTRDGKHQAVEGPWADDAESEDLGAAWFDADGDGDLDLYVVSGSVEHGADDARLRDRLYRNLGDGKFERATDALPDLRLSGSCVAPHDFDDDGDVDLFVGSRVVPGRFPHAPGSVVLRNDTGKFVDVTAEVAPVLADAGMVTSAVWTDVDGDEVAELVVAAQWQPVRVLAREASGKFVDRTKAFGLEKLRGQWNAVAAADLDGDGDQDLVVTNLGRNTKYKASAKKPQRLYARDFDGNGTFDVVEAKAGDKAVLPVRGLSCSSGAMPFLRQKFDTYDKFARATLSEIYGESLQQCLELSCNELRHLVLENKGERFVAHALPPIAQASNADDVAIADFDGDGRLDLVLAQNSRSPEPETGPIAGGVGLLLLGRDGCEFEAMPAPASGLVVAEDGAAVAATDLDGDDVPDLIYALNDGVVHTFYTRRSSR
ncbi:MAG: VCBS repeat-containing protein [bacterium]|nr:VCBS repeat-containing protein [bacterium]